MNNDSMLKPFVTSYVHIPFLGAGIVFGLLLLLYKDLDLSLRTALVPAIAVYMIGCSLIGYLYFELDVINCVRAAKNGQEPSPQPPRITWTFRILHGLWFVLLLAQLFRKLVL